MTKANLEKLVKKLTKENKSLKQCVAELKKELAREQ